MVSILPVPMVIIPGEEREINFGNIHNKNNKGGYFTYHLFCLFLQFCEAFKQLARAAFVQNAQFTHIFKRDKLMIREVPLQC